MAQVKINVPGIGVVTAEGMASEDTLNQILAAMNKSSQKKDGAAKKAQDEALKARRAETEAVEDTTSELDRMIQSTTNQRKAQDSSNKAHGAYVKTLTESGRQIGGGLMTAVGSLASGMVSLTAQLLTSYNQIQSNPIGAAAGMLNSSIDAVAIVAKTAGTVASGVVKAATAWIPYVGASLGAAADAANTVYQAAVDATVQLAKTTNDIMASEFKKTEESFKTLNHSGASFAGGMDEIRSIAAGSGVALTTLTSAASASAQNFRASGLSQGEGVKLLASTMNATSKTVGRSGHSLRDEMQALGYNYEEQGQIQSLYMAQLRASGVDLKNLAPESLARQTRDYAENLKVISDITGQDAKKLADKARSESMRGALMNKLDEEQRKSFSKAHSLLAAYGPEVQNALVQQLAGGVITDPKIAAMSDIVSMVKSVAGSVNNANEDITESTTQAMAEARERIAKSDFFKTLDTNALLAPGGDALVSAMASIANNIVATGFTKEQAQAALEAAHSMGENITGTSAAYAQLKNSSEEFARQMEEITGKNLPQYSELLAKNEKMMLDTLTEGIKWINDGMKIPTVKDAMGAGKEDTWWSKHGRDLLIGGLGATGGLLGGSLGATAGIAAGPAGTLVGGVGGFTVGASLGKEAGEWIANMLGLSPGPGKATGGIADGPDSGYLEKLHGTEAVIPTVGGKVPIDLRSNLSGLLDSLIPAIPDQHELTDTLTSAFNDLTTRILAPAAEQSQNESKDLIELMVKFLESQERSNQYLEEQVSVIRQLYNATV